MSKLASLSPKSLPTFTNFLLHFQTFTFATQHQFPSNFNFPVFSGAFFIFFPTFYRNISPQETSNYKEKCLQPKQQMSPDSTHIAARVQHLYLPSHPNLHPSKTFFYYLS
jgi:hypothetical protein